MGKGMVILAGMLLVGLFAACETGAGSEVTPTPTLTVAAATPEPTAPPTTLRPAVLDEQGLYVLDTSTSSLWYVGQFSSHNWSPDGTVLARVRCCTTADAGLDLFDPSSARLTRIFHGDVAHVGWSPDSSRLAFSSTTGAVFVIGRDGSNPVQLPSAPVHTLLWSPDGGLLATVSNENVYVTDLATKRTVTITREIGRSSFIASAEWSPAGRYLAFSGDYRDAGTGKWPVYLYDTEDDNLIRLGDGNETAFAWSPDGSEIAVADDTGLTLHDPARRQSRNLAAGPASGVVWSPDGSTIAFRFGEPLPFIGYEGQVTRQSYHLIAADGSTEPRPLAPARSLGWSPDGKRLAYSSEGCITGEWDIYLTNADGGSPRRLTNTPTLFKEGPFWSPSGQQLAYSTVDALMLVGSESGDSRVLATRSTDSFAIHLHSSEWWSPDGRYISFLFGGGHGICD